MYKNRFLFITLFFILLFIFPINSNCATLVNITADKQYEFANQYYENSQYFRAIGEYNRFVNFFPKDGRVESVMYKIGLSYYQSERYHDAVEAFEELIDKFNNSLISYDSYFMLSKCYEKLKLFGPAITNLHNLITITDDSNIKDKANYQIGWLYVNESAFNDASNYFKKISLHNQYDYKILNLLNDLKKNIKIPSKSPEIAGALSLFPGAGYLYCGRYKDALISFMINGILIGAAYESFDRELYVLGGLISLVDLGFYVGSIYGSITSVYKFNKNSNNKFIQNLKNDHKLKLSAGISKDKVLIFCKYNF